MVVRDDQDIAPPIPEDAPKAPEPFSFLDGYQGGAAGPALPDQPAQPTSFLDTYVADGTGSFLDDPSLDPSSAVSQEQYRSFVEMARESARQEMGSETAADLGERVITARSMASDNATRSESFLNISRVLPLFHGEMQKAMESVTRTPIPPSDALEGDIPAEEMQSAVHGALVGQPGPSLMHLAEFSLNEDAARFLLFLAENGPIDEFVDVWFDPNDVVREAGGPMRLYTQDLTRPREFSDVYVWARNNAGKSHEIAIPDLGQDALGARPYDERKLTLPGDAPKIGSEHWHSMLQDDLYDPDNPDNIARALGKLRANVGSYFSRWNDRKRTEESAFPVGTAESHRLIAAESLNLETANFARALDTAISMLSTAGVDADGHGIQRAMGAVLDHGRLNHGFLTVPRKTFRDLDRQWKGMKDRAHRAAEDWFDWDEDSPGILNWADIKKKYLRGFSLGISGEFPGSVILESAGNQAQEAFAFGRRALTFVSDLVLSDLPKLVSTPFVSEPPVANDYHAYRLAMSMPDLGEAITEHYSDLFADPWVWAQRYPIDFAMTLGVGAGGVGGLAALTRRSLSVEASAFRAAKPGMRAQARVLQERGRVHHIEKNYEFIKKAPEKLVKANERLAAAEARLATEAGATMNRMPKDIRNFFNEVAPATEGEALKYSTTLEHNWAQAVSRAMEAARALDKARPGIESLAGIADAMSRTTYTLMHIDPLALSIKGASSLRQVAGMSGPLRELVMSPAEMMSSHIIKSSTGEVFSVWDVRQLIDAEIAVKLEQAMFTNKQIPEEVMREFGRILMEHGDDLHIVMPDTVVARSAPEAPVPRGAPEVRIVEPGDLGSSGVPEYLRTYVDLRETAVAIHAIDWDAARKNPATFQSALDRIDRLPLDADDARLIKQTIDAVVNKKAKPSLLRRRLNRISEKMRNRAAIEQGPFNDRGIDVDGANQRIFEEAPGIQTFRDPATGDVLPVTMTVELEEAAALLGNLTNDAILLELLGDQPQVSQRLKGPHVVQELRDAVKYANLTAAERAALYSRINRISAAQRNYVRSVDHIEQALDNGFPEERVRPMRTGAARNMEKVQTQASELINDVHAIQMRLDAEKAFTQVIKERARLRGSRKHQPPLDEVKVPQIRDRRRRVDVNLRDETQWMEDGRPPGQGARVANLDERISAEAAAELEEAVHTLGDGKPDDYYIAKMKSGDEIRTASGVTIQKAHWLERVESGFDSRGRQMSVEQRKGLVEKFELEGVVDAPDIDMSVTDPARRDWYRWVRENFDVPTLQDSVAVYLQKNADGSVSQISQMNVASRVAGTLRTNFMRMGAQYMELGLLDPDVFFTNLATYHPDMYMQYERLLGGAPSSKVGSIIGTRGAGRVKEAKQKKKRQKMLEDAEARYEADLKKEKYRGLKEAENRKRQYQDEKDRIWSRFIERGLITDSKLVGVRALTDMVTYAENIRFFNILADATYESGPYKGQAFALRFNPDNPDFVKLKAPEGAGFLGAGRRTFGPKLGEGDRWVHRDLAHSLQLMNDIPGTVERVYMKYLSKWKKWNTVWAWSTHMGNFFSNVTKADFAGMNPLLSTSARDTMVGSFRQAWNQSGDMYELAREHGVIGSSFVDVELQQAFRSQLGELDIQIVQPGEGHWFEQAAGIYDKALRTIGLESLDQAHQFMYGFEDEAFKVWRLAQARELQRRFVLTGHLDSEMLSAFGTREKAMEILGPARKHGLDSSSAVRVAANNAKYHFIDYGSYHLPRLAQWTRKTYHPFFTYMYHAVPMANELLMRNPAKAWAYRTMFQSMNYMTEYMDGEPPESDDIEKMAWEYYSLNFYNKGAVANLPREERQLAIVDPADPTRYIDPVDLSRYVSYGRFTPFNGTYMPDASEAESPILPFPILSSTNPLWLLFRAITSNRNARGRDIYEERDVLGRGEKIMDLLGHVGRTLAPPQTPFVGRYWQKFDSAIHEEADYNGITHTVGDAIDQIVFGLRSQRPFASGAGMNAGRTKLVEERNREMRDAEISERKALKSQDYRTRPRRKDETAGEYRAYKKKMKAKISDRKQQKKLEQSLITGKYNQKLQFIIDNATTLRLLKYNMPGIPSMAPLPRYESPEE